MMEVVVNLNKIKNVLERNIYLDLDVEKYILEHYSSNLIKQSKLIEDIQKMILKELNVSYTHPNEVFDYIDETRFTTKIITTFGILNMVFLTALGIKYQEIKFLKYVDKEKLIIVMEVIK